MTFFIDTIASNTDTNTTTNSWTKGSYTPCPSTEDSDFALEKEGKQADAGPCTPVWHAAIAMRTFQYPPASCPFFWSYDLVRR